MLVRRRGLLIVVWTALMVSATAFQQDAVTVLRFREVWDGERAIPNASILIRGQRIAAVGTDIAVPAGARDIDLRRLTALPGLIDLHTHVMYVWDRAPGTTPLRPGRRRSPEETADAAAVNAKLTLDTGVTTIDADACVRPDQGNRRRGARRRTQGRGEPGVRASRGQGGRAAGDGL